MNPNLFIAGVPKAGTTSLFRYLALHPDVHPSNPKEPGYFHPFKIEDREKDIEFYKECFLGHSGQKYAIEATPGYFYGGKESAQAINDFSPDSKIILVLRNPVDRLFSFYKYKKSLGHISGKFTFETYLDECKRIDSEQPIMKKNYHFWSMVGGKYYSLLSEWHSVFGDRLRVFFFDDMVKDEPKFVAEICKWLELDKSQIDDNKTKVQNKSMIYRSKGLQRFATSFDNSLSGVWYYLPWLKWPLSGIYNLVNAKPNTEKISDSLRNELVNYYSSDISKTRNFLEEIHIKNIPEWMVR
ncbi:MAG: sulfotransferase family protein [Candidatus Poseidoniales archaeon]